MEDNQLNSPESSFDASRNKDTNIPGIKTNYNLDEFGIEVINGLEKATIKNTFPVEVFPQPVQEIINATNKNLEFPIDFIGTSILYAASVAIGNSYRVLIKRDFEETALLYLAIVARPGTNKTHPLSWAIKPLCDSDAKTYRAYELALAEYEKAAGLPKEKRLEQGLDELQKPVHKKFLLTDFTGEGLAKVHKFNLRGIGAYCDELSGWFKNFNRYNKGSEQEFWISNFNSKSINIDRKNSESIFILRPFISVCGTIQRGIISQLAKDSRNQNGFIDRILFAIPDDVVKEYWSESEIAPQIVQNWAEIITRLTSLPIQLDDNLNPFPELLRFNPEAKKLLFKWQRDNTDKCNEAESEALAGIFSKLDMYVCRLALILQLMRWACNEGNKEEISTEAVKGAIQLIEYFRLSAVRVYSILASNNPLDKLPNDKKALYNALPDYFTTNVGLQIAEKLEIPQRTFKYFLNNADLFNNVKRGEYEKRI